jgi:hypothetical protein
MDHSIKQVLKEELNAGIWLVKVESPYNKHKNTTVFSGAQPKSHQ